LINSNNPNHPPLRCECPPQWIGERCETPVHICDNFCLNGGTCRVEYGVPQCVCLSDFFGQKCSFVKIILNIYDLFMIFYRFFR
jgi:hypothetical protein